VRNISKYPAPVSGVAECYSFIDSGEADVPLEAGNPLALEEP